MFSMDKPTGYKIYIDRELLATYEPEDWNMYEAMVNKLAHTGSVWPYNETWSPKDGKVSTYCRMD